MANPVRTRREKAQVAAISAHNDETVRELVADAMEKVGGEGIITVEESKTAGTQSEKWSTRSSVAFDPSQCRRFPFHQDCYASVAIALGM